MNEKNTISPWLVLIVVTLLVAVPASYLALRVFGMESYRIPSQSMAPSYTHGDFIVVSKRGFAVKEAFGFRVMTAETDTSKVERGDVLVFKSPQDPSQTWFKRVVALPGDQLEIRNRTLLINNEPVELEPTTTAGVFRQVQDGNTYQIQFDARMPRRRAVSMRVPEGHFYLLGDNRDHSADSRMFGPVPADNVIGKVVKRL